MAKKPSLAHTLHNMFITMKAKNETKAVEWLNKLPKPQRNTLATYWTFQGFGYYLPYLKIEK